MRNLPVDIILMEIAQGLQTLIQNKDLNATIASAYALSDAEKAKAEQAAATIAQADDLLAGIKKKEDEFSSVNERLKAAQDLEAKNAEDLKTIAIKERDTASQQSENVANALANEAEKKRLAAIKDALIAKEADLNNSLQDVENTKAALKKRSDKIKAEIADL